MNKLNKLVDIIKNGKNRMEVWERETKRQRQIHNGICPSCGGHLTRGRRNKANDYKREWGCSECFTIHTI